MNEPILEAVLEEYAVATPNGNDLKVLEEFSGKYPQFIEELTDFAAARAVVKHAPEEELSEEEEKRVQESGLQNLRNILGSLNPKKELTSLVETAKAKGLSRSKFAAALGVSISLVVYLEKRRVEFSTIPQKIVGKIAEVLETAEETVASYLNQLPGHSVNVSYKTDTRPEESAPKSFAEAVNEDQSLTAEEKRKLLE